MYGLETNRITDVVLPIVQHFSLSQRLLCDWQKSKPGVDWSKKINIFVKFDGTVFIREVNARNKNFCFKYSTGKCRDFFFG